MKIGTIILKYVACDKYKQFHPAKYKCAYTSMYRHTSLASIGNVHIEKTLVSGMQRSFNNQANSQVQNLD